MSARENFTYVSFTYRVANTFSSQHDHLHSPSSLERKIQMSSFVKNVTDN